MKKERKKDEKKKERNKESRGSRGRVGYNLEISEEPEAGEIRMIILYEYHSSDHCYLL